MSKHKIKIHPTEIRIRLSDKDEIEFFKEFVDTNMPLPGVSKNTFLKNLLLDSIKNQKLKKDVNIIEERFIPAVKTITGNSIAHLYEYVNKRYAEQQVLLEVLNLKMTVLTNLLIEKFGWDINEIETPTPEGLEYLTLDLDFVQEKTREIYTKYDIKARKIIRDVKKEIKEKIKK